MSAPAAAPAFREVPLARGHFVRFARDGERFCVVWYCPLKDRSARELAKRRGWELSEAPRVKFEDVGYLRLSAKAADLGHALARARGLDIADEAAREVVGYAKAMGWV